MQVLFMKFGRQKSEKRALLFKTKKSICFSLSFFNLLKSSLHWGWIAGALSIQKKIRSELLHSGS